MLRQAEPEHGGILEDGLAGTVLPRLDRVLRDRGRRRTGAPRVVRQWSISTVLRVPTDAGPVWYKQVPPVFAHEGRITSWIATVVPDVTPEVLGYGEGWLVSADLGEPDSGPPGDTAGHPLDAVVRLQLAMVGREAEVLATGCPDRTPPRLLAETRELAGRDDLLTPGRRQRLGRLLPRLEQLVDEVTAHPVPVTLVHGDVNLDNSRRVGGHWVHIDWTDACLAHPFVELAQPLLDAAPADRAWIEAGFVRSWSGHVPEACLSVARAAAPVLGAAHQAGTYRGIIDGVGPADDHPQMLDLWVDRLVTVLGDEA